MAKKKVQYHINPDTLECNPCGAQIKCRFQLSEEEHFSSEKEAHLFVEKSILKNNVCSMKKKMKKGVMKFDEVVPLMHRDYIYDAFYNTTGEVDFDAIDKLTSYHYYKQLYNKDYNEDNLLKMMSAKKLLKKISLWGKVCWL